MAIPWIYLYLLQYQIIRHLFCYSKPKYKFGLWLKWNAITWPIPLRINTDFAFDVDVNIEVIRLQNCMTNAFIECAPKCIIKVIRCKIL